MFYPALIAAGFGAGAVNAIAGGGPLLTLAALTAAGIDPRVANLTSTVALCPGQLLAGWQSRGSLRPLGDRGQSQTATVAVALICGALGAGLLLATGAGRFAAVVPWLILLATALYAWSGRGVAEMGARRPGRLAFLAALALSSLYGGYFGGGNSFVVLALLGWAGLVAHAGAEGKNVIIALINLGAVVVFTVSGEVAWDAAIAVGAGGVAGSVAGVALLRFIRPGALRPLIIACGVALAGWFFIS